LAAGLNEKTMKTIALWMLMLLTTAASCERQTADPVPERLTCDTPATTVAAASQQILGRWQWEQTYTSLRGMATPKVETPASTGETRELRFLSDGKVEVYLNGKLTETRRYNIRQNGTDPMVFYESGPLNETGFAATSLLQLCPDRLILNNSYNDAGGDVSYRKVP